MHLLAPIIQKPLDLMVPSVRCLPWCCTRSWKCLTRRTVIWWRAGMIRGFVSLSPSFACLMRPPTLSNPLLSMTGSNFKSGLCEGISPVEVMHFSSSEYTSCCTLLMMISSAFKRSLTDKPFEQKCQPVHWLSSLGSVKQWAMWCSRATALTTVLQSENCSNLLVYLTGPFWCG